MKNNGKDKENTDNMLHVELKVERLSVETPIRYKTKLLSIEYFNRQSTRQAVQIDENPLYLLSFNKIPFVRLREQKETDQNRYRLPVVVKELSIPQSVVRYDVV